MSLRKDINEGVPHVPKCQERDLNSQKTPCNQKWCKIGAKGLLSHRDPLVPPWSRKEESRGAIMGVKGQRVHIYVMLDQGPNPRKNSSLDRQGRRQKEWFATKSDTSDHSMEEDKY